VPDTAQAILTFLAVIVPGFLATSGYRAGRAVPEHPEGLVTTARVITVSVFIALIAWKLGGRELYEDAQAGTALTSHEASTYRFFLGLLLIPPLAAFLLAQVVDGAASRVSKAREKLPEAPSSAHRREAPAEWLKRWLLMSVSTRLLHEGPTTWDRTWQQIRRTQPYVFTRITTKGGREIIGSVANRSRVAASPQPRDVFLEQVWRKGEDGRYYPTAYGLGAFIAGSEIETVEWVSEQGVIPSAQ
jgi:Family of unknown function (DUF6338)